MIAPQQVIERERRHAQRYGKLLRVTHVAGPTREIADELAEADADDTAGNTVSGA